MIQTKKHEKSKVARVQRSQSKGVSNRAAVEVRLAAGLADEVNVTDDYMMGHGLAHVVDGDGCDGDGRDGLHLDARRPTGPDVRLDVKRVVVGIQTESYFHVSQGNGVTEGHEFAGSLGGHDAGHLGHGQHVTLAEVVVEHGSKDCRTENDRSRCTCPSIAPGLVAHVDHLGAAVATHVSQATVVVVRTSAGLCPIGPSWTPLLPPRK